MEQPTETTETRVSLLESRTDKLEQRVTTHGEEIDNAAAQLHELSIRAHYRDESMGELKAMLSQNVSDVSGLRRDFAAECAENRNRFAQRDAASYSQVKGYVLSAALGAVVIFLLAQIGIV